jgi:hypothetical protein
MSISTASNTSTTIKRYRYVAVGSETSISGVDANGNVLSYTPGVEQVYLNGVLQVRGSDYTATTGTTITALAALVANDVVEIVTFGVFTVATALGAAQTSAPDNPVEGQIWLDTDGSTADTAFVPKSTVTTAGDLIYATGSGAVTRLGVGSTGQLLTVAGGVPTWAAPGGALTIAQIATGNVNSGTSLTISSLSSYDTLMLYVSGITMTLGDPMYLQINSVAGSGNYYGVGHIVRNDPQIRNKRYTGNNELRLTDDEDLRSTGAANTFILLLTNCKATGFTTWQYTCAFANNAGTTCNTFGSGIYTSAAAVSDLKFFPPNGVTFNGSGTYRIWGA